ncbi:MAG: hypothetical protein WCV91_04685 [Candidatus Margulisiibacteriota bacterium]|jgi:hypothetical protein
MSGKRFCLGLFALLVFTFSASAVPLQISYQGELKDKAGNAVSSFGLPMVLSIYSGASGGVPLWSETQAPVVVENGFYSVLIGSVTPLTASIFDGSSRYLGVAVNGDAEMVPRMPLISVPYAFSTTSAEKVNNIEASTSAAANKLLALDASAKFPNAVLNTGAGNGLDADKLDGKHFSDISISNTATFAAVSPAGDYQILTTDCIVFAKSGSTITLPAASASTIGKVFHIYNTTAAGGVVTVVKSGADTLYCRPGKNMTELAWDRIEVVGYTQNAWIAKLIQ